VIVGPVTNASDDDGPVTDGNQVPVAALSWAARAVALRRLSGREVFSRVVAELFNLGKFGRRQDAYSSVHLLARVPRLADDDGGSESKWRGISASKDLAVLDCRWVLDRAEAAMADVTRDSVHQGGL